MTNTQPPAKVAGLATQNDTLNRNAVSLMGLFGPEDDLKALVRLPGGQIRKVSRGSSLSAGRVVAIDADGLLVLKRGETRRIEMPGG